MPHETHAPHCVRCTIDPPSFGGDAGERSSRNLVAFELSAMSYDMIKVLPDFIFSALKHHQPASAYRLWFIAKDFNYGGCGAIPAKVFRQYLKSIGIPKQTFSRWLEQANTLGLITRHGTYYWLASWQDGAALVGLERLNRPVEIPKERFLTKGWLAWCWAGYLLQFKGPVARATMENMSGVPARTQYEYERKAEVINKANYASYGRIVDDPERAIRLYKQPGHYSKDGENRRRLPNSREVQEIVFANKGRLRYINQALIEVVGSQGQVASSHIARMTISGEIGEQKQTYRLYCENHKQTKKSRRKLKNWEGNVRERPDTLYEHLFDTHAPHCVWCTIVPPSFGGDAVEHGIGVYSVIAL